MEDSGVEQASPEAPSPSTPLSALDPPSPHSCYICGGSTLWYVVTPRTFRIYLHTVCINAFDGERIG